MATLDDVACRAAELPGVSEGERHGRRSWLVNGKANPGAFFTIPHFDGYSAILIQLRVVGEKALKDAILDGWLTSARHEVATRYLHDHGFEE